jgi:hypothetical protein
MLDSFNTMSGSNPPISILAFADSVLGLHNLYNWQCKILLRYEAGDQTAPACANFTGKTSIIFQFVPCGPCGPSHAQESCT